MAVTRRSDATIRYWCNPGLLDSNDLEVQKLRRLLEHEQLSLEKSRKEPSFNREMIRLFSRRPQSAVR
jgi:hypothetical protein